MDEEAQLRGQLFPHAPDPGHELASGVAVDQGHEPIANLEANQIHRIQIVPVQFLATRKGLPFLFRLRGLKGHILRLALEGEGQGGSAPGEHQKHKVGHARDHA